MHLSVVGSGYVGTTVAAAFADLGHQVTVIDVDEAVVDGLNEGRAPVHEPGLPALLETAVPARLEATTDYDAITATELTMLALPTPAGPEGALDTTTIEAGAAAVGEALAAAGSPAHTVVIKSTVLPGTTLETIAPRLVAPLAESTVDFAVNPEFLREGTAVEDFMNPDRIVFGTKTDAAEAALHELYEPLLERTAPPVVETGIREAELIKYASNAFLAGKLSLMNDIGNIAKEHGVDAYTVAEAIGLDHRIAEQYLDSGLGWGGSCLPKDTAALAAAARARDYDPVMIEAARTINDRQPTRLVDLLDRHVALDGARIAVLGLAFKPGTDDVRHSRAAPVIDELRTRGATPVAYDPVAMPNMETAYPELSYAGSAQEALTGADGAVVVTGWDEFAALDAAFARMTEPVVVDGRRSIDPAAVEAVELTYEGLTW